MAFLSQAKRKLANMWSGNKLAADEVAAPVAPDSGPQPVAQNSTVDEQLLADLSQLPVTSLTPEKLATIAPGDFLAIGAALLNSGDSPRARIIFDYGYEQGFIREQDYHSLLAMLSLTTGDMQSAAAAMGAALEAAQYSDISLLAEGVNIFLVCSQFEQAMACLERLYTLGECSPELTGNVVDVLVMIDQYQLASTAVEKYFDASDDMDVGLCLRAATVYAELQDFSEAEYFLTSIADHDLSKEERIAIGSLYFRIRKEVLGRPVFEKLLEEWPDDEGILIDYGTSLFRRGYIQDAMEVLGRCVDVYPRSAVAWQNLAVCLRENGQLEDASRALHKAIAFWDQDFLVRDRELSKNDLLLNQCVIESDLAPSEEHLKILDRIIEQEPLNEKAIWHRAIIRLATGHYRGGWSDYQLRWKSEDIIKRPYDYPRWSGEALGDDEVLLIYAEQGVGDEVMFASCLKDLRKFSNRGRILVECDKRLISLYQNSFEGFEFTERTNSPEKLHSNEKLKDVTCQLPIGDLPFQFRNSRADFQSVTPYLRPTGGSAEYWQKKLEGLGRGPLVGISWRGGTKVTRKNVRSIPLDVLGNFLKSNGGYSWVSLQYGDVVEDLDYLENNFGVKVHHFPEMNDTFDLLVALVEQLDSVVSVQTALVHLCGASNVDVHCLLPQFPEWRYRIAEQGRSVWYPSVRLYRQIEENSWPKILDNVATELSSTLRSNNV